MRVEGILGRKMVLPNYFSMTLTSAYGRMASAAYFGGAPHDGLKAVESQVAVSDPANAAELCRETITFRHGTSEIPVAVDVADNNQLLGACRKIPEFRHGYEPEIHCVIDMLTGPDAVIFDIGANWGPISIQAALRDGFRGGIFAFEPQARAFANLTGFVAALSLDTMLFPQNLAVSDREGTARLSDDSWRGNVALTDSDAGEACRLVRLDDLALPEPQLIKIDVEGHERAVLAGASNMLQRARPFVIFEDWLDHPKDHFAQLAGYRYVFYRLAWYNPFTAGVEEKPPFPIDIQVLALEPIRPEERGSLPRRINVLASPHPLSPDVCPGLAAL